MHSEILDPEHQEVSVLPADMLLPLPETENLASEETTKSRLLHLEVSYKSNTY